MAKESVVRSPPRSDVLPNVVDAFEGSVLLQELFIVGLG